VGGLRLRLGVHNPFLLICRLRALLESIPHLMGSFDNDQGLFGVGAGAFGGVSAVGREGGGGRGGEGGGTVGEALPRGHDTRGVQSLGGRGDGIVQRREWCISQIDNVPSRC
jgi:hypothetical protein